MTTTDATYRKEIVFDRESRDYAMRLDGELVGYARSYHEAEITLDELVFELLSSGATATASALDGDSDADECAASACVGEPVAVVCATCDGEGRIPVAGYGDQAGGWAETCPDCGGHSPRQRCLLCGGDHSAENCPRIHPIDATDLLMNADTVLAEHPGPGCPCDDCMRRAVVLTATSYVTKLRFDAGLICQYCGEDHADSACPQKRPLLAPRVCGNCGGQHVIQRHRFSVFLRHRKARKQ